MRGLVSLVARCSDIAIDYYDMDLRLIYHTVSCLKVRLGVETVSVIHLVEGFVVTSCRLSLILVLGVMGMHSLHFTQALTS